MSRLPFLSAVFLLAIACRQETAFPGPGGRDTPVRLCIEDGESPLCRSHLTDASIESRISCVTLASYVDGELLGAAFFPDSLLDRMRLPLPGRGNAQVYALANMGNLCDSLPAQESALGSLRYRIPGYTTPLTGLSARGLPMAGTLTCNAGESGVVIPVKRLLAKVTVQLSVEWEGVLQSARVCQMNAVLRPFGESRAESVADLLAEEEYAPGTLSASGSLVFYVPENLQGSDARIGTSAGKSADNSLLSGRAPLLSYLEVEVAGQEPYSGTLLYRSFLGANATSDFSLRRNCRYHWNLRYGRDGIKLNDWKHQNGLTWQEERLQLYTDEYTYFNGETIRIRPVLKADTWGFDGLVDLGVQETDVDAADLYWWEQDFTDDSFVGPSSFHPDGTLRRQALHAGRGYMNAEYTLGGKVYPAMTGLYVYGPAPTLELTVTPSVVHVGETLRFTAWFTDQDGRRNVTQDFRCDPFTLDFEELKGDEWVTYVTSSFIDIDPQGRYVPTEAAADRTLRARYAFKRRYITSDEVHFSVLP